MVATRTSLLICQCTCSIDPCPCPCPGIICFFHPHFTLLDFGPVFDCLATFLLSIVKMMLTTNLVLQRNVQLYCEFLAHDSIKLGFIK